VRTPAHFCGLFGLKPTERRIPNTGHIPELPGQARAVRHMNVLGPLTRSIDDLSLITRVMSGTDESEWDVPPMPWVEAPVRPLRDCRIAWTADFAGVPVIHETKAALRKLAADLAKAGCKVEERNPDGFSYELAWELWGEIAIIERAATGGERSRERVRALNETLGTGWAVARGSARGLEATVGDYAAALTRRDGLIANLERFFGTWDALACPVTVSAAIGHVPFGTPVDIDGVQVPYFIAGTAYTCPFNLTGHPSVVIPLAKSEEGLPIGIQLVGGRWGEPALLALAREVTALTGGFTPPRAFC
jgi:amidase